MGKTAAVVAWLLVIALSVPLVASSADVLYVGDRSDHSVKKFDGATGAFLGSFIDHKTGGLGEPSGLVFDDQGNMIVADQRAGAAGDILQYSAAGTLLQKIVDRGDANAPKFPGGLLFAANVLYVADAGTCLDEDTPQGAGCEPDQDIAVEPRRRSGRIIVFNYGVFDRPVAPPDGALRHSEFHPRGMVVGPDGFVYVSNYGHPDTGRGGEVLIFDPLGKKPFRGVFISSKGGGECACADELNRPDGLVFGPDGNLYITSFRSNPSDTDKILIFQGPNLPNPGAFVGRIVLDAKQGPRSYAHALIFGADAALYVPISNTGEVRRYDYTSRTYTTFVSPSRHVEQLASPWYLTFGGTIGSGLQAGPNLVECICADTDRTTIYSCAYVDCSNGQAQDSVCGPVCANRGGEWGTGCLFNENRCVAP